MKKTRTKKKSSTAGKKVAGKQPYSKYLFILFFLAILTLAILLVRPFLATLIVSAIIAYVFYPIYSRLSQKTNRPRLSAVIVILLLVVLLSIPVVLVTGKLAKESYDVYQRVKESLADSDSLDATCSESTGFICGAYNSFVAVSEKYDLDLSEQVADGFSAVASQAFTGVSNFLLNIPSFLLHLFIGIFAMYYMFVDGKRMFFALKDSLPLRKEHSDRIFMHFNDVIYATVYGSIVLAIIQGFVATLGYFIFGVTSPIIFGFFTIIAAFIPFVGAAIVWLPISLSMMINGLMLGDSSGLFRVVGLLVFGVVFVSTIDNVLRPKIVGDRARIHPLVILLGVFGGLALFGFAGLMIGPLLLTLFMASLKIYAQEKNHIA
jgi:predicted PurR-regulated permease PerM